MSWHAQVSEGTPELCPKQRLGGGGIVLKKKFGAESAVEPWLSLWPRRLRPEEAKTGQENLLSGAEPPPPRRSLAAGRRRRLERERKRFLIPEAAAPGRTRGRRRPPAAAQPGTPAGRRGAGQGPRPRRGVAKRREGPGGWAWPRSSGRTSAAAAPLRPRRAPTEPRRPAASWRRRYHRTRSTCFGESARRSAKFGGESRAEKPARAGERTHHHGGDRLARDVGHRDPARRSSPVQCTAREARSQIPRGRPRLPRLTKAVRLAPPPHE